MLAWLNGKIAHVKGNTILLKLPSGLGYLVQVYNNHKLLVNENLELFILTLDKQTLGFYSLEEREMSQKLLELVKLEPQTVLDILHELGVQKLKQAIVRRDLNALLKVRKIGEKTAKKILEVLGQNSELLDFSELDQGEKQSGDIAIDFTQALAKLGYHPGEIVFSISQLKKSGQWQKSPLSALVKEAVNILENTK